MRAKPPPHPVNARAELSEAASSTTGTIHLRRMRRGNNRSPERATTGTPAGQGKDRCADAVNGAAMVRVELMALEPGVTDAGEKVAVAPVGKLDAVKVTALS